MASLSADWNLARVSDFRSSLGLSQAALAERVGISRPTLAKIEEGGSTKRSTINFLVTRLQEEFGDQFLTIDLKETVDNSFDLHFEKKEATKPPTKLRTIPSWEGELNAISRKIMEVCSAKNTDYLPSFHSDLLEIIESYEKLSGMKILTNRE